MKKSLFFAIWMALLATPLVAQTIEVSGEYHGQVLWDADTVRLMGDVVIEPDEGGSACLTIERGTWVIAEGYYRIALCYCAQNSTVRALSVNGVENPDADAVALAATGGWANGTDDWQILVLPDPTVPEEPLLVKLAAGENRIRFTNVSGGGSNLDYLFVYSPDVQPARLEN